jgi:hypothetical protein
MLHFPYMTHRVTLGGRMHRVWPGACWGCPALGSNPMLPTSLKQLKYSLTPTAPTWLRLAGTPLEHP